MHLVRVRVRIRVRVRVKVRVRLAPVGSVEDCAALLQVRRELHLLGDLGRSREM